MYITKEEIIDKVNKRDTKWAYDLSSWNCPTDYRKEVETVYDQHWGDGNEYYICLYFKNHDLYVLLEGTYSSWDSPDWHNLSFGEPYEFKETRYKPVTLEYIRDKKIDNVLKKD